MTANDRPPAASRPLHTTTVRFDADLWDRVCLHSTMLSVGKATLINTAVRELIVRREAAQQVEPTIQESVVGLARRLSRLETAMGFRAGRATDCP
jgi:hypothetical protein